MRAVGERVWSLGPIRPLFMFRIFMDWMTRMSWISSRPNKARQEAACERNVPLSTQRRQPRKISMTRKAAFLLLIVLSSACFGEVISSDPGEIYKLIGTEEIQSRKVEYDFHVVSTDPSSESWAPMAFVGAIDVDARAEFQVFIFQKSSDGDLVLGHRYIEGDELVSAKTLFHGVPLRLDVKIIISVNEDGLLRVEQPGVGVSHEYQTGIRNMRSYVGVVGAKADFRIEAD